MEVQGEPKVKRKLKTPSQLELLEKTYAMEMYPSESLRAELSVKLGLTDRQLQMWFCHRRLKDRKGPVEKKIASPSAVAGPSTGSVDERVAFRQVEKMITPPCVVAGPSGGNVDERVVVSNGLGLFENMDLMHHQRVAHKVGTAVPRISKELKTLRRVYEPPLAISEQRAISSVEAQLGESLREDGPILGMEFDPLPPGAFGAPIVTSAHQRPPEQSYDLQFHERPDANPDKGASRAVHEYQFLPEKPSIRNDANEGVVPSHYNGYQIDIQNAGVSLPYGRSIMHGKENLSSAYNLHGQMPSMGFPNQPGRLAHSLSPSPGELDVAPRSPALANGSLDAHYIAHPINGLVNTMISPEMRIVHEEERVQRKRKTEEARIAKEVELHEKRIRKELEKQDILQRKREEQMRKEMERQDRERRLEEERWFRKKQREEERCLKEKKREMERREKILQKEYLRAEKFRLREEMRKEKEASRLQAANLRAAARRFAKESVELIEDQRLELMELAALSGGLPSILALDGETLQNLDLFKDKLPEFPPKSVYMKRPFGIQPWTDSEENVGNLLMIWRFLITFADVLGLWPFTLDEFFRAFHEDNSRLLEEIHIALLRSIIKDIEDVARTPANALVGNLSSAFTPVGGHPQIVEGACSWGFNLLSWKHHLSPLTWPEVLRQFALSAGFGPKLKRGVETACLRDCNGEDDGAEIISNLRSGVTVGNAVAIMRERGFSNLRKSRHRLTPGTVKYAVFHVLSLEGSKGLPIIDVVSKIQKSGLRDLTTSRTPEASISAALSRDTKLFERTAPSTYCVRSPYRKDPADAELIITEAREKIQLYQNGHIDGVEPEDVDKEDNDRDQDYASDVADDLDTDDLDEVLKLDEGSHSISRYRDNCLAESSTDNFDSGLNETLVDLKVCSTSLCEMEVNGASGDPSVSVTGVHSVAVVPIQEDSIVDECSSGETWVQGLTEGDYNYLSIEERLHVLVALIGIANEGNTVRIALEERLELANALKKQMWAEAKHDKRRIKEESISKIQHSSPLVELHDQQSGKTPLVELHDQQSGKTYCDDTINEKNHFRQDRCLSTENLLLQQSMCVAEKSKSDLKAFIAHQADEMYVYRSLPLGEDRRHNRYWQFITTPRTDPGSGRIFVEFCTGVWRVIDSEEGFDALLSSLDVRGLRESQLHLMLRKIESSFKRTAKMNLKMTSGDHSDDAKKEVPEAKQEPDCYASMHSPKSLDIVAPATSPVSSAPVVIQLESKVEHENGIVERCKDFEKWMLDECCNPNTLCALKYGRLRCQQLLEICKYCHSLFSSDDSHCPCCHRTFSSCDASTNFSEHITQCKLNEGFSGVFGNSCHPPGIRLVKAQLATIEAFIPPEALDGWSDDIRKSWALKLHMAPHAEEILQALTVLEDSISRDFLSAKYKTTHDTSSTCKVIGSADDSSSRIETVSVLPWIPLTTPAVALRLMELDASIHYSPQRKEACETDENGHINNLRSRYSVPRSSIDDVAPPGDMQQDNHGFDLSLKRGRGRPRGSSRARGGKSQRGDTNCSQNDLYQETTTNDKFGNLPGHKGRPHGRGGRKKGRYSLGNRRKTAKTAKGKAVETSANDKCFDASPAGTMNETWISQKMPVQTQGNETISNSEISEFGEDNNQTSEDEYDEDPLNGTHAYTEDVYVERVEDGYEEHHVVGDRDDVNYDDDIEINRDGEEDDYYVDDYLNSDYQDGINHSASQEGVRNADRSWDRGSGSSSSDYSS